MSPVTAADGTLGAVLAVLFQRDSLSPWQLGYSRYRVQSCEIFTRLRTILVQFPALSRLANYFETREGQG